MNKGSKILVGTLCAVTALGAVGGVCYKQIPSFKNSIDKAFKINDTKANIGFETPDKNISEGVKPITPEEFASTYKFALPSTFLGGLLYVLKMPDDNLVVSSSVGSGVVLCDVQTGESIFDDSGVKTYNRITILSNNNCIVHSSESSNRRILMYRFNSHSLDLLCLGYALDSFLELSSGDYVFNYSGDNNSHSLGYYRTKEDVFVSYTLLADVGSICETILGKLLISYRSSSSSMLGVWLFDCSTGGIKRLYESGYSYNFYNLSNGNILFSSSVTANGLLLYRLEDDGIVPITSSGYFYVPTPDAKETITNLGEGKYLISSSISSCKGVWIFDCKDNTFTQIDSSCYCVYLVDWINDTELLLTTSTGPRLYNIETFELTTLTGLPTGYQIVDFSIVGNGDLLAEVCQSDTYYYIYRCSMTEKSCVNLFDRSLDKNTNWVVKILSNGNALIFCKTTNTGANLYLYDYLTASKITLLSSVEVTDIIEQEDGTYLIKTSGEFDYEYNCEDNSIKLVYTVTQAE